MKKILVVDDEHDMVTILKARLEKRGFAVVSAYDGAEGLEKIDEENPDLIILDIIMPKMDGYTVIKELKKRSMKEGSSLIPVIVLTAKDKMQDLFAMEGVTDYIIKPFEVPELLDKINKLIGEAK
ncbi:MAG: response regulator [PVC group bacterium]|nr:response regulator [PVC group bacterium]